MRVIGTAGHVDHGKSTLVRALTGIDPDRLKEEKKRQMTIDLGFAWYDSPGAGSIGIVDVPGHRDFIENMLAGVGGIDAALLVIAADEGVMPQTREHLAIIDLLQIKRGLVVLTKTDLISDPEWLKLVESDIHEVLSGTILENASLLRVSAMTGDGIPELKQAIDKMLRELGPRIDLGRARLPVDRVFSITGFGTVVTGTLVGGSFKLEEQVEILPSGKKARIRGLQSHKKQETEITPGTRTAMNLSGIDISEIKRGDTIIHPGQALPTRRIDARLKILADDVSGVKHNDTVKFFLAATETTARIRLLRQQNLEPGGEGWVQIETEKAIVAEQSDRFILRRMSPARTIGGGVIIDPHPKGRYKLNDDQVTARLEALISTSTRDKLKAKISDEPFVSSSQLLGYSEPNSILGSLVASEEVKKIPGVDGAGEYYVEMRYWRQLTGKIQEVLQNFHKQYPLKLGINSAELARRLRIPLETLSVCLQAWETENLVKTNGEWISLMDFNIKYSANQTKRIQEFNEVVDRDPFNPPNVKDAREMLTDEVYQSFLDQGEFIQVSADVFLRAQEYRVMLDYVVSECEKGSLLTLAELRDRFSTSRKYSQAFLEYLDRKGITIREGDGRKLKNINKR